MTNPDAASGISPEATPQANPQATPEATGHALLTVRDLRIVGSVAGRERTIVAGLSLDLSVGETVGIVGESGSGKSMTARALVGLLPDGVTAHGDIRYAGRPLRGGTRAVRGSDIALIFQDPFTMLNPLMPCGDQISELLTGPGGRRLRRAARREEAVRRLAEVGIDDPGVARAYPFELSGGMRQRVAIAAAIARDPKVLIADESTTALDVTTQREILDHLSRLQRSRGMGLILITHDLRVAFSVCDRVAVLYAGSLLEQGPATAIDRDPRHPYTLGLLLSEPPGDRRLERLDAIEGSVPAAEKVADQCAFAARCRWARERCVAARPPLTTVAPGRTSACVREDEIVEQMRSLRDAARHPVAAPAPDARSGALVEVRDLYKRYGERQRGKRAVQALAGVSIEIGAGESVGLVGESGSGKTTLARSIVGLEAPDAGEIRIDGIDASDYRGLPRSRHEQVRRTVQMVFQDPYSTLNPARTIGATLRECLAARGVRRADHRGRVSELLQQVGLPAEYAARKPVALSGGERQRVAVARALAADPRLIVCDEVVSALDVSVQAQILNLLLSLRRDHGVGYLFVTHDLAVARQITDRIYVLRRGEIVESGPTAQVLDRPTHPYTRTLIGSVPGAERLEGRL